MRKFALILAVAALAALGTSCTQLRARDQINKGVAAFKGAQYPEAVEHFKTAVELDPNFITARLYLATAYMQQYFPGSETLSPAAMYAAKCRTPSKAASGVSTSPTVSWTRPLISKHRLCRKPFDKIQGPR